MAFFQLFFAFLCSRRASTGIFAWFPVLMASERGRTNEAVETEQPFSLTQVLSDVIDNERRNTWRGNAQESDGLPQEASIVQEQSQGESLESDLAAIDARCFAIAEAETSGGSDIWQAPASRSWYDAMAINYPAIFRPSAFRHAEDSLPQALPIVSVEARGSAILHTGAGVTTSQPGVSPQEKPTSSPCSSLQSTSCLVTPCRRLETKRPVRRRLWCKTPDPKRGIARNTPTPASGVEPKTKQKSSGSKVQSKGHNSRDQWIEWMLASFSDHDIAAHPTSTNWAGLKFVWGQLPVATRVSWCRAARSGSLETMERPTLAEIESYMTQGSQGAEESAHGAGEPNASRGEFCDRRVGHRGGMLTWHGSWGAHLPDVQAIMSSTASLDEVVQMIKTSAFYKELWRSFQTFITELLGKHQWPEISITMEVTKKRKKADNLIHFHVAFSDKKRYHKPRDATFFNFVGSKPHFVVLHARGDRQAERARSRLHYYIMTPKAGSVWEETNFHRGCDYLVQSDTIMNLWRLHKLSSEAAKAELISCRVQGFERCMREIEVLQREEYQVALRAEWLEVMQMLPQRPFRVLSEVEEWKKNAQELYGTEGRFKFLVLNGPSQVGKTRFAQSLYGASSTLVVSCQNVQVPNLRPYRRYEHKCIIYDEGSSKMVVNNKAIFQANCDFIGLGQSVCNQHFYLAYLYGTPQIVCCNDWMKDIADNDLEAKDWLAKNAVLVEVQQKLYLETPAQEEEDMVS